MRTQFRSLLYFTALFMFLFSNSIFAGDWDLVNITIPAEEDVASQSQYTEPSKDMANKLTDWSDKCVAVADRMRTQMQFLVIKRDAAKIAADSGWNWQGKITNIALDAVSKSYSSLLNHFIEGLKATNGKIHREQQYAAACLILNARYPTLEKANKMMVSMHDVAVKVRENYAENNGSTSDLDALLPVITVSLPDIVKPEWLCYGNSLFDKSALGKLTCEDKWNTPYKALNIHRVWCGGDKDPNPSVAGCGFTYYNCREDDVEEHQVKYCNSYIVWHPPGFSLLKRVGICGSPFRDCPYSTSHKGVHDYYPVYSTANGKKYISGYSLKNDGFPNYGRSYHRGSTTPPSAKAGKPLVHGSNGVGVDAVIPDATPNCNTCIADSHNCPNCGSSSNDNQASASPGLRPSDGSFNPTVRPGGTHKAQLVTSKYYYWVYWYVLAPGQSLNDIATLTPVQTDEGHSTGTETKASLSYTFPDDAATGVYTIVAVSQRYRKLSEGSTRSYTITVAGP